MGKAARSSNGRTSPSGGEYLGSNPGLAALNRKIGNTPSGGEYLGSNPGLAAIPKSTGFSPVLFGTNYTGWVRIADRNS